MKPLEGLRILDLSRLLPGPLCALHLADMGADVIKVEDAGAGDYARTLPPIKKKFSYLYSIINRNKRSVKLDFGKAEQRKFLYKLVATADVVVESYRPGVPAKMGLDYETLRQYKPDLIYCSISGFGQNGALSQAAGHDLNYCALAGVTDQIGRRNEAPAVPNLQIADILGGSMNAATAILAALYQRSRTGKGTWIDISMFDCTLAQSVIMLATREAMGGQSLPRGTDLLSGGMPFYDVYPTADGRYMALGALEYKFWERFCMAVNRPDLKAKHIVFAEDADWVRNELKTIFQAKTQAEWTTLFAPVDCCCTPVLTLGEALKQPHVLDRGLVVESEHPTEGKVLQYACPIKMSDFEFSIDRQAPAHGADTAEVFGEIGFSVEEIENMFPVQKVSGKS